MWSAKAGVAVMHPKHQQLVAVKRLAAANREASDALRQLVEAVDAESSPEGKMHMRLDELDARWWSAAGLTREQYEERQMLGVMLRRPR